MATSLRLTHKDLAGTGVMLLMAHNQLLTFLLPTLAMERVVAVLGLVRIREVPPHNRKEVQVERGLKQGGKVRNYIAVLEGMAQPATLHQVGVAAQEADTAELYIYGFWAMWIW